MSYFAGKHPITSDGKNKSPDYTRKSKADILDIPTDYRKQGTTH